MSDPKWLEWARALQALAQTGEHFAHSPFDRDRYEQVGALAAEIMACYTEVAPTVVRDLFDQQSGYATPKVDVRGAVFKGDALLMVREKLDGDRWTLPGGFADVNDTPSEAVIREIYEESGYQARAVKLIAAWDRNRQGHPPYPFHCYKLFFLCELLDETPVPNPHHHETGGARFFAEDELPPESEISLSRLTSAQLARCFAHHRQPALPAEFD